MNLRAPDWRAGALPITELITLVILFAVFLFCQYLCSSKIYLNMYPVSFPCGLFHENYIILHKIIPTLTVPAQSRIYIGYWYVGSARLRLWVNNTSQRMRQASWIICKATTFSVNGRFKGHSFYRLLKNSQYHDLGVVDFQLGAFWVY